MYRQDKGRWNRVFQNTDIPISTMINKRASPKMILSCESLLAEYAQNSMIVT